MMEMSTVSLLGLSEMLSVIVIFALGAVATPIGLYLFIIWDERRPSGMTNGEAGLVHPDGSLSKGVVMADYIDEQALFSIAKQKGIESEPNLRERVSSATRSGDVGGAAGGLKARLSRQRREDEREVFDIVRDPNTMLAGVLEQLEQDGSLDRHIGHAAPLLLDDATIERIRDVASDAPEQAAFAILRERLMAAEKRREFATAADRGLFVLIESAWEVTEDEDERVILILKEFRPPYLAYDSHQPDLQEARPISVPDGVTVAAQVTQPGLTGRGRERLVDGARVNAGILATITDYDTTTGDLDLSPIAVFGRYGRGRDGIGC